LGRNTDEVGEKVPPALLAHAKRLGIAVGQTLLAESEEEMILAFDLALYTAKDGPFQGYRNLLGVLFGLMRATANRVLIRRKTSKIAASRPAVRYRGRCAQPHSHAGRHRPTHRQAVRSKVDARISRSRCGAKCPHAKSHGRDRPHPSLSPPRTDINTTGLDCPAPAPSPLDGDSPMYRPRPLVDLATPITDTALMVHGFEPLPQIARR
jgi:hypothetical protein